LTANIILFTATN